MKKSDEIANARVSMIFMIVPAETRLVALTVSQPTSPVLGWFDHVQMTIPELFGFKPMPSNSATRGRGRSFELFLVVQAAIMLEAGFRWPLTW